MPYQSVLTGNNVPAAKQGQYQSVLSGFVPGQYAKVNAQIAATHTNPAALNDVPSLNAALKAGQINQGQWMQRFKQIQPQGPKIQTGLAALPGVINEQDIQPIKNTFVGAYQKAAAQAKYLAGPTSTQPQRNAIINNQKAAATNPAYTAASKTIKPGTSSASGLVQAQKMAAGGANTPQIKTFLQQDAQKLATQTKAGLSTAATIASFSAPGEGILAKTLGRAKSAITDTAESTAGKAVTDVIHGPNGDVPVKPSALDNQPALARPTKSPAKTTTPVVAESKATIPQQGSGTKSEQIIQPKLPKPGLGEAGGVAPGQVVQDTQAMLDKHAKTNAASLDVQKNADITKNKNLLNETEVAQNLDKRTTISPADRQTLQDYRDAKAAGLTPAPLPEHLQEADAQATAYAKAQMERDAAAARASGNEVKAQKIETRNPETYTHREAIGKGSSLELTMRGDKQSPSSLGQFGRKTASSNKRSYMALTDEQGNRSIVNIDKNKVTQFENGGKTKTELGNLNPKTNTQRMQAELKPVQRKIDSLENEQKILSATKSRSAAATQRLGNIKTSLQDAYRQHVAVTNKYDINEMDGKTFVGNDGKKYTMGQATTSEITKHAGQKYYVDPELTNALAYNDSQKALNNTHFIESTKKLLEDKQLAFPKDTTAPKNFKTTTNPYFPGYKLDPKLAEVLDDIAGRTKHSITGESLDAVSHFLRQTIVYMPIKHDFNMAAGYFIDRGLTRWINPAANFRMFMSLRAAAKSLATHDQFWQDVAKTDFSLVSGDSNALGKVVKQQLKDTLNNKERVALFAKTTKLNPATAYKALQHVSVFDVQDILNLARIKERTTGTLLGKGQSLEDAIAATKKYNFQYRMPSRAALPGKAGRIVKETLGSDKVYFGNYTYDKFRIAKNILKDTANPKTLVKHPVQNLEAANKLAATVFIASAVWPLVNKGIQKLTGDKNAHITAPGVASVAEVAQKVATHKEAPLAAAGSQVSIAQPISLGSQLLNNTDSFTSKHIHDPNTSAAQKTEDTAKWLLNQLSPVQKANSSKKNTVGNKTLGVALGLVGVSIPKNSPEANKLDSLKYDTLPGVQSQAKAAAAKGDTQKAIGIIAAYDQKILAQAQAAAKAEGKAMPSAQQLKQAGYYYDPTNATVQSWTQTKANTGTLQNILNQTVAPKKGEPGYYQYEAQKRLKTQQTKTYNRFHPSATKPVI